MRYLMKLMRGPLREEAGAGGDAGGGGTATATATEGAGSAAGARGGQGAAGSAQGAGGGNEPQPLRFYDDNGKPREDVINGLGENAKAFKGLLQKYNNDEALHQGVQHLQYLASQKSLTRPDPNADESVKAQHQRMVKDYFGVPDDPKDYGVQRPDDIPEEVWDQDRTDNMLKLLHEHNASPELVKALADAEIEQTKAILAGEEQREEQRRQEANEQLRKTFGNETNDKINEAIIGLRVLGVEVPENFSDLKLDYPTVAKIGLRVQELISEDQKVHLTRGNGEGPSSHDGGDYDARIKSIKTDASNPFYADFYSDDPNRQQRARAEIERLYRLRDARKG